VIAASACIVMAIASILLVARFTGDSRAPVPAPERAASPAAAGAGRDAAAEQGAPPARAGAVDGKRPEITLLEELPGIQVTRNPDSPLRDLRVSFKLDPRLTRGLNMGDRWVSPPRLLQVGNGENCTVEASIRGLNAEGKAVNAPATWHVADPGMVKMSRPGRGNTVKLTVVRPGKTIVEIASQGITKRLPLHARSYGGTIMIAMAQE